MRALPQCCAFCAVHYLALRCDPEPAIKPEVEQVRAELARR